MTLAQVDAAIESILSGGQSVSIDGINYSKASLSSLHALRDKLIAEGSRSTRPLFRGMNFSGMGYGKEGCGV